MSTTLPLNDIIEDTDQFSSPLDPLDDSWSLYQELISQSTASPNQIINQEVISISNLITSAEIWNSAAVPVDDQPHSATQRSKEDGLELMKIFASPNSKTRKKKNRKIDDENGAMEQDAEEGPSVAKKMDHNAKEKIRRMKLNASYLALQALLPNSRRSKKKRWCAPAIVDRVLKYIPELENEVQALRSKKENVQSAAKNKKVSDEIPKVLFNKVNEEEAIIQICMARKDYQDGLGFTSLLQSVEDEGIFINSASTLPHLRERNLLQFAHPDKRYYIWS